MDQVRLQPTTSPPACRRSIFTEVGLVDEKKVRDERSPTPIALGQLRPARTVRFRSRNDIFGEHEEQNDDDDWESVFDEDENCESTCTPAMRQSQPFMSNSRLYRLGGLLALVLALMLPIVQFNPMARLGARASSIPGNMIHVQAERSMLVKRDDTTVQACKRWSGQSTIVNGTLYMYGFRTITDAKQDSNTWSKRSNAQPQTEPMLTPAQQTTSLPSTLPNRGKSPTHP